MFSMFKVIDILNQGNLGRKKCIFKGMVARSKLLSMRHQEYPHRTQLEVAPSRDNSKYMPQSSKQGCQPFLTEVARKKENT